MTPQSARDALRALADACADIPPPQVQNIDEVEVLAAEMRLRVRSIAFLGRNRRPSSFSTRWVAGDLKTHDRQARLLTIETGAVIAKVGRLPQVRPHSSTEQQGSTKQPQGQPLQPGNRECFTGRGKSAWDSYRCRLDNLAAPASGFKGLAEK
jgi:hypothetical protein